MSDKRDLHKSKNKRNQTHDNAPRAGTDQRVAAMSQPAPPAADAAAEPAARQGNKKNKPRH
jgi:hypothetical protein